MVTLLEYAQLANAAYAASTDADSAVPGWIILPGKNVEDRSVFSGGNLLSSGLQMRAYLKTTGGDIVIAVKGTKPTMVSDLMADLKLVCEGIPQQAYQAIRRTQSWLPELRRGNGVTLVGHSLGGGICQIVGAMLKIRFVTFNAPGMWTNAVGVCNFMRLLNTTKMGMNFINWHDPVGNFGKHIGDTTRFNTHKGHSIVGFIEWLRDYSGSGADPLA